MRISIVSTVLADPDLALGRVGPSGLSVNGQEIVDEVDFFRAASRTFYHRGSEGVTLQFNVERSFDTILAAERFMLLHYSSIPKEGVVTCEVGEGDDTQSVYMRNAVVAAVGLPAYRGRSVTVQYTIKGPFFESDIPEEEIPDIPDGEEEDPVMLRGKLAIASGQNTATVIFSQARDAVPHVMKPNIMAPAGSPQIDGFVRKDSVTINGFTVDLTGTTPDNTYQMDWAIFD